MMRTMAPERQGGGADPDPDPEKRKKVGNYVLGPCLGEGTFTKLRIGTHIMSKAKVAVKIVAKRVIVRRDAARRNFRREALLLQHVRHPNIVRLYEAMETPHCYYLVLELAAQGHLLGYLSDRKCLEEEESRLYMRQMVSAVDHLHQSGIVHRDLKLDNFLLNASGDIKIVDFGLGIMCQRDSGLHTQCGSPLYAAPEIFGNRRYGPPVDIWSLGVCLYAMVLGRLPFLPDPSTNLPQLHALILKGPVIPNFLSASLQQLLSGLLEVRETRRLSSSDLVDQPWLTCHRTQPIPRYLPVAQAPPPSVDTDVVRFMTAAFSFNESDVIHSVTERKLNASSATYHLLKRHLKGSDSADARGDCRRSTTDEWLPTVDSEEGHLGSELLAGRPSGAPSDVPKTSRLRQLPPVFHRNHASSVLPSSDATSVGGLFGEPLEPKHVSPGRELSATALPLLSATDVTRHYKQCILFLKQARSGLEFSRRSLSDLPTEGATAADKNDASGIAYATSAAENREPAGLGLSKLPRLNAVRRPLSLQNPPPPHPRQPQHQRAPPVQRQQHPAAALAGSSASADLGSKADHAARYVHVNLALVSRDLRLDVQGQAALKDRETSRAAGEGREEEKGREGERDAREKMGPAGLKPPPPPPPPNNATLGAGRPNRSRKAGPAFSSSSHAPLAGSLSSPPPRGPSSSASSSSSVSSLTAPSALRDPFGRDTRLSAASLHKPHDRPLLRLAGHSEAAGAARRSERGVAFVAPLSSRKTLTTREKAAALKEKKQGYYLVTHLAADLHRKRGSPSKQKSRVIHGPSLAAADSNYSIDYDDDDLNDEDEGTIDKKKAETFAGGSVTETGSFFTPVIRVTITSNAKH